MGEEIASTLEIYLVVPDNLNPFLGESKEKSIEDVISQCGLEKKISGVVVIKKKGDTEQYAIFSGDYSIDRSIGNLTGNPFSNLTNLVNKVQGYIIKKPSAILLITDTRTSQIIGEKFQTPYTITPTKYTQPSQTAPD